MEFVVARERREGEVGQGRAFNDFKPVFVSVDDVDYFIHLFIFHVYISVISFWVF